MPRPTELERDRETRRIVNRARALRERRRVSHELALEDPDEDLRMTLGAIDRATDDPVEDTDLDAPATHCWPSGVNATLPEVPAVREGTSDRLFDPEDVDGLF